MYLNKRFSPQYCNSCTCVDNQSRICTQTGLRHPSSNRGATEKATLAANPSPSCTCTCYSRGDSGPLATGVTSHPGSNVFNLCTVGGGRFLTVAGQNRSLQTAALQPGKLSMYVHSATPGLSSLVPSPPPPAPPSNTPSPSPHPTTTYTPSRSLPPTLRASLYGTFFLKEGCRKPSAWSLATPPPPPFPPSSSPGCEEFNHTPSIAFRHLPPNSARFSYATEVAVGLRFESASALLWLQSCNMTDALNFMSGY